MTATHPIILVVGDPDGARAPLVAALEHETAGRVHAVSTVPDAMLAARAIGPALVMSELVLPEADGFELCRRLRADVELAATKFIIAAGPLDAAVRAHGIELGVDDYLCLPAEPLEVRAKVRAMLRLARIDDAADRSFDQLLGLLGHLVDLARPGAGDRGRRLAETALKLAELFEVPAEFRRDLELAAYLNELGPVVDRTGDWRAGIVTSVLLRRVDRLRPVADLVGAVYENWDGSGSPDHLQRGQIPMRARLLRAAIDFHVELARCGGDAERAIEALDAHAGTWYDPLVVRRLEQMLRQSPALASAEPVVRLTVERLEPGMVLSEDLFTSSGLKLLARGAVLGEGIIETITRRHAADPILAGVAVHRSG